jgi:hypothetical protein
MRLREKKEAKKVEKGRKRPAEARTSLQYSALSRTPALVKGRVALCSAIPDA